MRDNTLNQLGTHINPLYIYTKQSNYTYYSQCIIICQPSIYLSEIEAQILIYPALHALKTRRFHKRPHPRSQFGQ